VNICESFYSQKFNIDDGVLKPGRCWTIQASNRKVERKKKHFWQVWATNSRSKFQKSIWGL